MRKTRGIGMVLVLSLVLLLSGCSERGKAVRKYRSLGIAELQKENYEAAIDAFRHALDYYGTAHQDKEEEDILSYLAESEYRAGKYEEALGHYEQLLRKGGRKAAYLDLACAAAVKAGKGMEVALPYYEEAEKQGGDRELHLEALYLLAESARDRGEANELETVRAAYEKLYPSAKEDSRFLLHYGDLLVSVKKLDEAFAVYETGETLTAADAEQQAAFRQREAICREYSGDYADALRRFTALLESGQGNREEIEHEIAFLKTRVEGSDG